MNKKIVSIVIIAILISFICGYGFGSYTTIKTFVGLASGFVEIDRDLVRQALTQYKENIAGCYPSKI